VSCPICQKKAEAKYRPFCSARCADIDLGKWMTGAYAIPSTDPDDAEEAIDALEQEIVRRSRPH
jgi:endogenous inhibitor of DNA gyrase (YacG/DUF329 family)